MLGEKPKDKGAEEEGDIKKTPEYRAFRKLLKQVIKAPPLHRSKDDAGGKPTTEAPSG